MAKRLIGPQGDQGVPGSQGLQGVTGSGSTLFFSNPSSFMEIQTFDIIMSVQVTTTETNQRVKLDATWDTIFDVPDALLAFSYDFLFVLRRPPIDLKNTSLSGGFERGSVVGNTYVWNSNFTDVDVPGPPGTYIYEILLII